MPDASAAGMRIAVIGLGSMGLRHAANARALGADIVGVDPSPARRRAAADAVPGIGFADTPGAAFAETDAAVIASPSGQHAEHLTLCIGAGCHALVEKPVADGIAGLDEALRDAEQAGLTVAVAQNLRFHPAVAAARDRIGTGALGRVLSAVSIGASYLPDWRPGQDYRRNYAADPVCGGVIFDWVHEIDMLAHLLGAFAVEGAAAAGQRVLDMPSEEEAGLLLRHEGGCLSTLLLSYATRPALRRTMLLGPEGRLEIDIPGRRLTRLGADGSVVEDTGFGGRHEDDYRAELEDFLAAVSGGTPPRCSGREALDILSGVVEARRIAGLPGHDY